MLDPFTGVANLLGKITIFDLGLQNPILTNHIKAFTGDGVALSSLSIGEAMELRHRFEYGKSVYELFYHNWVYNQGPNQR